ncbi:hypothetical protein GH714_002174 [Hevea brasiliensis]|uniref:Retrotransposon gag domain-containing protein n=1 Tax=Hevea brasiliensis TaxID=3981 RepID=A0A6A6N0G7_HEVBR|nr:hypothetical protein GH714_002174 [Hevea brasiliensis]
MNIVRDTIWELYKPGLRQIGSPEFHKPYLDAIDRENLYLRGYRIPKFNAFLGEDGQSTLEHVVRFTIQYGELTNYENFATYKLRNGESADAFIAWFKKMRNKCKVFLPKIEYVKMAQRGLDIKLRKKFQGMGFRDFYELAAKVVKYEELLMEELN